MNAGSSEKSLYKFSKEERLHHRSLVEGLFRCGKSFYEFPFRVTWRKLTDDELEKNFCSHVPQGIGEMQMMVTVPKKKRRRAVDRVRIRRLVKEAYRLNRLPLKQRIHNEPSIRTLTFALVYIHDQNLDYKIIEEKVKNLLSRLESKVLPTESEKN